MKEQGPVTMVTYQNSFVCWSTVKEIRVINFTRNRQPICRVSVPDYKNDMPISCYSSLNVMPSIVLKIDKGVSQPVPEPNCIMYIHWLNIRKKVKLKFKGKTKRFEAETLYTLDDVAKHY